MPQPRVPAQLRKLRATYRARKASATGADGDELRAAPHFLNPRARAIYKSAIAAAAAGQLRKVDRDLAASWALIVDQQREAAPALEEVSAPTKAWSCSGSSETALRLWLAFPTAYASTRRCGPAPRPTNCRRRRTPGSSTRGSRCGWCAAVGRTIRANLEFAFEGLR